MGNNKRRNFALAFEQRLNGSLKGQEKNEILKRLRRMLKSVKDFANSKITRTFAKFSADNEISSKAKRKLKDLQ